MNVLCGMQMHQHTKLAEASTIERARFLVSAGGTSSSTAKSRRLRDPVTVRTHLQLLESPCHHPSASNQICTNLRNSEAYGCAALTALDERRYLSWYCRERSVQCFFESSQQVVRAGSARGSCGHLAKLLKKTNFNTH